MSRVSAGPALVCVGLICAGVLVAQPGQAQSLPGEHRTAGLLGSGGSGHRSVDLTLSSWAASSDELADEHEEELAGLSSRRSRASESIGLRLGYVERFKRSTLAMAGRASAQRFGGLTGTMAVQRGGAVGWDVRGRRTRLLLQQDLAIYPLYSPPVGAALFTAPLAEVPPEVTDDGLAAVPALRSSSAVSLQQGFGRRLIFDAATRFNSTSLDDRRARLRQTLASAHLTYTLGRDLRLVTGYGVQQGRYRLTGLSSPPADIQNIDLGVDYQHALAISRRTTVGFSSGPVVVRDRLDGSTRTVVGGQGRLNHQIGRTWQATGAFVRSVSFIDAFASPMLTSVVAVRLGGLLGRRTELAFSADGLRGRPAAAGDSAAGGSTDSITGAARVAVGVTRAAALTAEYRYQSWSTDGTTLGAALPAAVARGSVRVGFDLRVPLVR